MGLLTLGIPLWIVLILLVIAFVVGGLVERNNSKAANAALASIKAKAAAVGVKL